jgi:hypothetical protein
VNQQGRGGGYYFSDILGLMNFYCRGADLPSNMGRDSPRTLYLSDLRHDAGKPVTLAGPLESGVVSKWRMKDRVSPHIPLSLSSTFLHLS